MEDGRMAIVAAEHRKDLKLLLAFVHLYCRKKHAARERSNLQQLGDSGIDGWQPRPLCRECADLLAYAVRRRQICPLDPKPSCKHCRIHCYNADYRLKIRTIIAYSGRRMLLRGRLDYLWHYFM